jgi:Kef-type K+ transport system membrane component KefB
MKRLWENRNSWISGTLTALAGVMLVRIVSPEIAGMPGKAALVLGYVLAVSGIIILACSANRADRKNTRIK